MTKKTLITGTRKGIGRFIAENLLSKGHIVFGCSRDESDLKHENYYHYCLDVSNEEGVKNMVNDIRIKFKGIDNLINNAGIASMNHSLITPYSTVKNIFSTNVFGTFLFCREVGKVMQSQKKGKIVNFATVATPLKLEGEAVYAASKAAVQSLTQVLSFELAPFGITVNAVGPTPVETDLIKAVPKAKMDALLARQAIKRFGTFDDVMNAIEFFIDDKSEFITGQTIFLGGV